MTISEKSMADRQKLFRGTDPREVSMYSIPEAAHYLHMPVATLRSWVEGRHFRSGGERHFSSGVIRRPDPDDPRLSFTNLVEAHVLRALRTEHGVPMQHVRKALEFAESRCGIERLLISDQLRAAPGEMFLKEYGRLLSLSRSGQLAMERILGIFLRRLSRDLDGIPVRLYPFVAPDLSEDRRIITIDPRLAYGRPAIASKGVSTAILTERVNAGENIEDLARYYGLDEADIEEAILYERRAA
ncbi:MAG TPA: DUF433 domain-containing protein [Thermoanaerobaculia bacterium]|nr:DUF433 domain-containing protein [Thermoanaerobaculia bacterium]